MVAVSTPRAVIAETPAASLAPPVITPPPFRSEEQQLYDPRHDRGAFVAIGDYGSFGSAKPLSKHSAFIGREEALFSLVFSKHLASSEPCKDSKEVDPMVDPLVSGQFHADIVATVEGFFTRNDLSQTAYFIARDRCLSSQEAFGEALDPVPTTVVVTTGEQVVFKGDLGILTGSAVAIRDLDQDGLHELIITRGTYHSVLSVLLYRYVGGAFIQEGPDYEASEGTACHDPEKIPPKKRATRKMWVLYFQPTVSGEMPTITKKQVLERYEMGGCSEQ